MKYPLRVEESFRVGEVTVRDADGDLVAYVFDEYGPSINGLRSPLVGTAELRAELLVSAFNNAHKPVDQ